MAQTPAVQCRLLTSREFSPGKERCKSSTLGAERPYPRTNKRRSIFMNSTLRLTIVASVAVMCSLALSCSKQSEQTKQEQSGAGVRESAATQPVAPKVKVGANLKAKSKSPAAPDTAKQKSQQSSIGKGQLTASTMQPSSFWTEEVDVDDDGVAETSDFLYDAQNGILYTYREDDFA